MSAVAIIFDMNGVIIDDMPFHKLAWREFAGRFGKAISDEEYDHQFSGRTNLETFHHLLGTIPPPEQAAAMEREKEELYRKLYLPHRRLLPGLERFLESLRTLEIPLAVATAAPPENVTYILDGLNIRKFFAAVIDAAQVSRGKPDPEIFLKAADTLGVPPHRCLVFEDGLLGIEAARRAGMKVIGVTTTHAALALPQVEDAIPDFQRILAESVLERLIANPGR